MTRLQNDHAKLAALFRDADTRDIPELVRKYQEMRSILKELLMWKSERTDLLRMDNEGKNDIDTIIDGLATELTTRAAELRNTLLNRFIPNSESIIVEMRANGNPNAVDQDYHLKILFEAYTKYVQNTPGLKIDSVSLVPSKYGLTRATFIVRGKSAYRSFIGEAGTHRFEDRDRYTGDGKTHTHFIQVNILPEVDSSSKQFPESDFTIETTTSQGPGGQNVNKVETAVRLKHRETGEEVVIQDTRHQARNKEIAFRILRARLAELDRKEKLSEQNKIRRIQTGVGKRTDRVRNYDLITGRVRDERIQDIQFLSKDILSGGLGSISDVILDNQVEEAILKETAF